MRPPVPWAHSSVEQITHTLSAEVEKMNQLDIREAFDDGMEQILQISGGNLPDPIQLARNANLAIIAQR
jgi:hypothetical protein